jgi:TATA-box binding protein (TBP) (component of TFIID and TFIIIB)
VLSVSAAQSERKKRFFRTMDIDSQYMRMRSRIDAFNQDNDIRKFSANLSGLARNTASTSSGVGGGGAGGGGDDDSDVFKEVENTLDETLFDHTSEEYVIGEVEKREAAAMRELELDTEWVIVNGPNKPVWYEECARRSLESLTLDNYVVVAYLDRTLNCLSIVSRSAQFCIKFNPAQYAAMIFRQLNPRVGGLAKDGDASPAPAATPQRKKTPAGMRQANKDSATTLVFPTGKATTTGAKSFSVGLWATRCAVDIISSTVDDWGNPLYPDLKIKRSGIKNVVASLSLFFHVNISALAKQHSKFVHTSAGFWVSVVMELNTMGLPEYADRTATVLVFEEGMLVFTSAKGRADVIGIFRRILPILVQFAKPNTARWQTPLLHDKASKMDAIRAPPPTLAIMPGPLSSPSTAASQALVTTTGAGQSLVDTIGGAKLQKTNNKRSSNTSEAAVARNLIALTTMEEHTSKKAKLDAQRAEMLSALRATGVGNGSSIVGFKAPRKPPTTLRTKMLSDADAFTLISERPDQYGEKNGY